MKISGDNLKVALKILCKANLTEHYLGLNQTICIGRSRRSDLQLNDEKISVRHCLLKLKSDRLEVTDLDSKNGTYLNGIRIDQSEVFVGDEIRIGECIITLEETHMPPESVQRLTFPGSFNHRLNYELKADFTGARIKNQRQIKDQPLPLNFLGASHGREIDLRKSVMSNLKVSKHEIHVLHKKNSVVSSVIEFMMLIVMTALPLLSFTHFIPMEAMDVEDKFVVLLTVLMTLTIYLIINFKILKFSLGERVSGIKKLYLNQ